MVIEQIQQYQKQYRIDNRQHLEEYYNQYKENNESKLSDYRAEYYQIHKEKMSTRYKKYLTTITGKYSNYKSNAKFRKISFDLTKEDFSLFWQTPCTYCGDSIKTVGIDRKENTIGYILSNIVSCCAICNKMKLTYTFDNFLTHIKNIITNNIEPCIHTFKPKTSYSKYRRDAIKRNLSFEISLLDFKIITSKNCCYCGVVESMGIDRIDSIQGYVLDNIVPCCTICNRMKLNYDTDFFTDHIQKIYKHNMLVS